MGRSTAPKGILEAAACAATAGILPAVRQNIRAGIWMLKSMFSFMRGAGAAPGMPGGPPPGGPAPIRFICESLGWGW
jgi:hypothetical protein